ncbi:MAG: sugar phosphate isomerase/epimerase, partial [Candidatus Korarchaeota archaeon]|nr:sugar phosphate isomerase/epimerase [Candidatus Korarchaeota archaeon]
DFQKFYSETNEDIGLTFDIGHANINNQIQEFLTYLPKKIVHIHAHDNQGEIDQHLGVGDGTIDWNKVTDLLKMISYDQIVIVESVKQAIGSVKKLRELLT